LNPAVKKSSGWVIFFGLLAIPAAIYYSIQLWNQFTNKAELRALVKTQKVELPWVYGEFLQTIDSPMGRQELRAVYDTAAKDRSPFNLEAVHDFTDSARTFRWSDIDLITVKIANVGRKPANNVKVFFPTGGFAQITKDRAAVNAAEYKGWIELGTLEPSSQFVVNLWTNRAPIFADRDVRVNSDEGAANVREWYVSRDENRWAIGFGPTDVVFFGFMGLAVFALILLPLIGAIALHSDTKTGGAPKETEPESSN